MKQERTPNLKLREARLVRGWSQRKLAEMIGTTEDRISRWENGYWVPDKHFQTQMCQLFQMNARELGFLLDPPPETPPEQVSPGGGYATTLIGGVDLYMMQRRLFLQQIFGTGLLLSPLATVLPTAKGIEAIMPEAEAIISSCWRLLRGKDMAVVPTLLVIWLPVLDALIKVPSPHQTTLMRLAAQGYLMTGILASHKRDMGGAEWAYTQSLEYSRLAKDPNLEATALKQLATEYQLWAGQPEKALQTYQQALPIVDQFTPLLQGRIYLGLALASAQCQQQNDAERYLGKAKEVFPDKPENDPSFTYADCDLASLHIFNGLTYLSSKQPQKALDIFGEVEKLQAKIIIPQRTILHMINCQAEAAVASKEKEQAQACLEAGAMGAIEMQSKKRLRESLKAYYRALKRWPNDKGLKGLEGLYQQGKGL